MDEWALVRRWWGDVPEEVAQAVRHHHEREDGSGYPDGLCELTPLTALIAVVDVYTALRSDRCYRPALDEVVARQVLLELALPGVAVRAVLDAVELRT